MGRRSEFLDAIRGIAILLVFATHYFGPAVSRNIPAIQHLSNMMWIGVDLFFILSGYLLGGLLLKHRMAGSYYLPFFGRRALRIVPLYLVCLFVFFGVPLAPTVEPIWPYALLTLSGP